MITLLNHLTTTAQAAALEASKAEEDAAIAIAYNRDEHENMHIVKECISTVMRDKSVSGVISQRFVASLAALPCESRDQALNDLQQALHQNSNLARQAGWMTLKKRIRTASDTIDAARNGARNADGLSEGALLDTMNPLSIAKVFIERHQHDGLPTIRRWKERWYQWSAGVYLEVEPEHVHGLCYNFLATNQEPGKAGPQPIKPTKRMVEEVLFALAPMVLVEGSSPTVWLDADARARPAIDRCAFCSNGTLDVDGWLSGSSDAFIAPTPALFILKTLAMPYNPDAQAPRFDEFVRGVFDGDEDRIMALRILFGYWLLADTRLQVIVVFSGMPQTGKGTLLSIIQGVLGISCCNPSFEDLSSHFGLESLVGANLAVLSDVHDTGRNVTGTMEKLLKISGEDQVDVSRKHKTALNGILIKTRFILAMNEIVTLPDPSGAFFRRLVILPFLRSFAGQGQAGLSKTIVVEEGSGVLMWALEGLRLLNHVMADAHERGKPTKDTVLELLRTKKSMEFMAAFDELGSPARAFLREMCVVYPMYSIDVSDLFCEWETWLMSKNYKSSCSQARFTNNITVASGGAIQIGQRTDSAGNRPRVAHGVITRRQLENESTSLSKNQLDDLLEKRINEWLDRTVKAHD